MGDKSRRKVSVDKKQLIKEVHDQIPDLSMERTKQVVNTFIDVLVDHLKNEDLIYIRTFGYLSMTANVRKTLFDVRSKVYRKNVRVILPKFDAASPLRQYFREKYKEIDKENEEE